MGSFAGLLAFESVFSQKARSPHFFPSDRGESHEGTVRPLWFNFQAQGCATTTCVDTLDAKQLLGLEVDNEK